ncbi:MAG: DUF2157 domain-containing protein, partial [Candidatus Omnitrophota bacterium]
MNIKAIKWLYQELPELITKGVLTEEAAGKIRQYYGEVKSASKTSIILIISGTVGALLIGLGIISLLAHNWEQFSRFTRALISFMPLVIGQVLALWVLWKKYESSAFKEASATFLSLMVGASIALISQTYNIPGDTGTFILTWMLLIVPVVYIMQASIPAAIYLVGITAWAGSYWGNPNKAILFWPLAAVVFPHFIWALRREIYVIRTTMLSLIMIICISIGAGASLGKTWAGSWIIIFSSIYSIFYSIGCLKLDRFTTGWQWPLRVIGGAGIFILALQFTFRYVWQHFDSNYYGIRGKISGISAFPDHIVTIALIVIAILLFYDNAKRKDLTKSLLGALPLLAIIGFLFRGQVVLPLFIFNAYLLILSVSRILLGMQNNSLPMVNTGMLMLAILIIARFF